MPRRWLSAVGEGAAVLAFVATIGVAPAAAQSGDTPCLKPGTLFGINGTNYNGSTIDVRAAPEILKAERGGSQPSLQTEPDFQKAFRLGTFQLQGGAYSATVRLPRATKYEGVPIIREIILGRTDTSDPYGRTLPTYVQLKRRSATAIVYKGNTATVSTKPKVKVNGFMNMRTFAFGASKVYVHILRPNGTKLRTVFLGKSRRSVAFPCGQGEDNRSLSFQGAKPGEHTLVVNTSRNKKRAPGGIRLTATVKK